MFMMTYQVLEWRVFLYRLSLFENDEQEEPEIEDYESNSDHESTYTLVKKKDVHTISE